MLILLTRHWKVFFEKIYLSSIERDVATSKIPFYHFCLGSVGLEYFFFGKFFHVCKYSQKCILNISNFLL